MLWQIKINFELWSNTFHAYVITPHNADIEDALYPLIIMYGAIAEFTYTKERINNHVYSYYV